MDLVVFCLVYTLCMVIVYRNFIEPLYEKNAFGTGVTMGISPLIVAFRLIYVILGVLFCEWKDWVE